MSVGLSYPSSYELWCCEVINITINQSRKLLPFLETFKNMEQLIPNISQGVPPGFKYSGKINPSVKPFKRSLY